MAGTSPVSAGEAASLAIWQAATPPSPRGRLSDEFPSTPPMSPSEGYRTLVGTHGTSDAARSPQRVRPSESIPSAEPPLSQSAVELLDMTGGLDTSVPLDRGSAEETPGLPREDPVVAGRDPSGSSSAVPPQGGVMSPLPRSLLMTSASDTGAARAAVPVLSAALRPLRLPAIALGSHSSEFPQLDVAEHPVTDAARVAGRGATDTGSGIEEGVGDSSSAGAGLPTVATEEQPSGVAADPDTAAAETDPHVDFSAWTVGTVERYTRLLTTPRGVLLLMQTHMLELFVALLTFVVHISMTRLDTVVLAKLWFGAWVAFWILISMRVVIVAHWTRATCSLVYAEEGGAEPRGDFEMVWEGSATSWLFIGISASFCLWYFFGIFCWTMAPICRGLYFLLLGVNGLFLLLHSQMMTWSAAESGTADEEVPKEGFDSLELLPVFVLGRKDAHRLLCASGTPLSSVSSRDPFTGPRLETSGTLEQPTCSVCLCDFEEGERVAQLPCGHLFHEECIRHWLQMRGHCPLRCEKPSAALLALAPEDDLDSVLPGGLSLSRQTTDLMLELTLEDDVNNFTGSSGPEGVALRRMPSFLMSGGRLVGLATGVASATAEPPRAFSRASWRVSSGRLTAGSEGPSATSETPRRMLSFGDCGDLVISGGDSRLAHEEP